MTFFKPKKKILILLLINLIFYSERLFSQQVADTLIEAFQCNTSNERTINMLGGLKRALFAAEEENCKQVKESLNIPHVQSIIQSIQNNRTVLDIKKTESHIKLLLAEIEKTDDPIKKADFQREMNREHSSLLRLQAELKAETGNAQTQSIATAITELNTFADTMIQAMNQNKNCFKNNAELNQQAMASLTGIAGLIFSSSTVGVGLMTASKITQKIFTMDTATEDSSALSSTKLSIGLRCALQNISSIHCENIKNADLLELTETEADALCATCSTPEVVADAHNIKSEMEDITQLSATTKDSKQAKFIRNFRKGAYSHADRLENITNFLQNIDDDFFDEVAADFDEKDIKEYLANLASVNNAYQDIERYSKDKSKEAELREAKKEFYDQFAKLAETDFFDIGELTDLVDAYSEFQANNLRGDINTDALSHINMNVVYDVLALSRDQAQRTRQKTAIRDSKDMSRSALIDFSTSFKNHINRVLNDEAVSSHSKSELCIRLLGIPDISEIKDLCNYQSLYDSGKSIRFSDYMDKPHKERACAYENFLRKKSSSDSGGPLFSPDLIDKLIKQSE